MAWYDVAGAIASPIIALYDIGKDIFNVDRKRDLAQSKALMYDQYSYDRALMNEGAENQFGYQQSLMDLQNRFNTANMQQQYIYNQLLSNKGREIYQLRQNGINPAAQNGVSGSGGSVSLPATQAGSVSSPVGSVGGIYQSSRTPIASQVLTSLSSVMSQAREREYVAAKTDSERIKQITMLREQQATIQNLEAQTLKAAKDAGYTEEQIRQLKASFQLRMEKLNSEIDNLERTGKAATKTADAREKEAQAAEQNAATAAKTQTEQVRHNQETEAIQRAANAISSRAVAVDEAKVQSTIDEMKARTRQLNQQANLTEQDIIWYADKVESMLELNEVNMQEIANRAAKEGLDVETYYYRMIVDQLLRAADIVSEFVPTKAVNQIARKITQRETGKNARGNKMEREDTWFEYNDGTTPPWQKKQSLSNN